MSVDRLIREKNKYFLLIGEISKKMKKTLEDEDLKNLFILDDQINRYILEIRKIDRSISMQLNKDCMAPDISSLSGSAIKKEVDSTKVMLQDLIRQNEELMQNVNIGMDAISRKIGAARDTKKLISGYLSSNDSNERFINYNI